MRFLESNELTEWCRDRGLPVLEDRHPLEVPSLVKRGRTPFTFSNHNPTNRPDFVRACITALGDWDECLLWITCFGIWPSSEDWPAFYALRGQVGEKRSLDIAPGHFFQKSDAALLVQFIDSVVANAWDAYVIPVRADVPTDRRLFLSHDEWAEIESAKPQALAV